MDYYRNIDHFCRPEEPRDARGISYERVEDLLIEPVTKDFFKAHARIDFEADDKLVMAYLRAARQELEMWTQRSFGEEVWRFKAWYVPKGWHLMYGPVAEILSPDFEVFGDLLQQEGRKVDITYRTRGIIDDNIRIAICRYAAGMYAIRENILINDRGNPVLGTNHIDEAKEMLKRYRNITRW